MTAVSPKKRKFQKEEEPPITVTLDEEKWSFVWKVENFKEIVKKRDLFDTTKFLLIAGESIQRKTEWTFSLTVEDKDGKEINASQHSAAIEDAGNTWLGIKVDIYTFYLDKDLHGAGDMLAYLSARVQRPNNTFSESCETVGSNYTRPMRIRRLISLAEAIANLHDEHFLRIPMEFKVMAPPVIKKSIPTEIADVPLIPPDTGREQYTDLPRLPKEEYRKISPYDVTLISKDNKEVKCHKVILAVTSSYFGKLFLASQNMHKKQFDDLSGATLEAIIDYIYSGNLGDEWRRRDVIVNYTLAAKKFELWDVLQYLDENLSSVCTMETAKDLLALAKEYQLETATKGLMSVIKNHVARIETPEQLLNVVVVTTREERTPLNLLLCHPEIVDDILHEILDTDDGGNELSNDRFSAMFPLLFRGGDGSNNILSFLDSMAQSYSNDLTYDSKAGVAALQIFNRLGYRISEVNKSTVHLVTYLIQVYMDLRGELDDSIRQNIFAFMTHFPLSETKMVFVFNTPSGMAKYCGYALNNAVVDTTQLVLEIMNNELSIVEEFGPSDETIQIECDKLLEKQHTCNLDGWISSGVLLMNSRLTYKHGIWDSFTNQLVRILSRRRPNLVFVLAGKIAQTNKDHVENKHNHLILEVCHPTYNEQSGDSLRWETQLPFTNANFFLYQASQKNENVLIDWTKISGVDAGTANAKSLQKAFFEEVLTAAKRGDNSIDQAESGERTLEVRLLNGKYFLQAMRHQ